MASRKAQVNAHEDGAQLVVGLSIMRTGSFSTDTPKCSAAKALQQLSVARVEHTPLRPQRLFVQRRCHQRRRTARQHGLGRLRDGRCRCECLRSGHSPAPRAVRSGHPGT
jgi:hypothetical protein